MPDEITQKHSQLKVVIVQHIAEKETQEWFARTGGPQTFSTGTSSYIFISDPTFALYSQQGIGHIGWGGIVNSRVVPSLKQLKGQENIDFRLTGKRDSANGRPSEGSQSIARASYVGYRWPRTVRICASSTTLSGQPFEPCLVERDSRLLIFKARVYGWLSLIFPQF
ncbi:hypothetical protein K437DRAFT_23280 [Tilletiaria anomala UBC 951]|uniref:Uncharacterized protein n=1 Tax=Tilletiaria anomala (strain ATCC 24038 / CBS 436.72 / UBC 951) TaxID=1037660 RepID=A0A066VIQ0_TILAU|nr:uncharacterized protein K437DRAFT_23280 [Tilletiaria anomala UBC 951]KDN38455.1 hypothetical protein K437DRAFT_23280 [Tilletiaria anomala UBC 951]